MAAESSRDAAHAAAIAEFTRDLVALEVAYSNGLMARAVALTGFIGVILSLAGATARNVFDSSIKGVPRDVAVAGYMAALLMMAASAGVVLLFVLMPKLDPTLTARSVLRLRESVERVDFEDERAGDWIEAWGKHRGINSARTQRLRYAYFLLFGGLSMVALSAGILVWHAARI